MTLEKGLDELRVLAESSVGKAESRRSDVERWQPVHRVHVDLRIAADGQWLYRGQPMVRHELVQLFSSILRREVDGYYLVTPHEKARIVVDDAPLLIVDADLTVQDRASTSADHSIVGDADKSGMAHHHADGPGIHLARLLVTTNMGGTCLISPRHPLMSRSAWARWLGQAASPCAMKDSAIYVLLERGLSARVSRSVFYRLVDHVTVAADGRAGMLIADNWFPLDG